MKFTISVFQKYLLLFFLFSLYTHTYTRITNRIKNIQTGICFLWICLRKTFDETSYIRQNLNIVLGATVQMDIHVWTFLKSDHGSALLILCTHISQYWIYLKSVETTNFILLDLPKMFEPSSYGQSRKEYRNDSARLAFVACNGSLNVILYLSSK